ncbi:MAG: hypothetical protein R3F54_08385 [Alphaproteobacteria bacterium]
MPRMLFPISALLLLATESAAMDRTFHLSLTGDEGVTFEGSCTREADGSATDLPLSGTIPQTLEIEADGLSCRITSDGHLIVDIQHDGSRTRSTTRGGTIRMNLH